jgi:molecular chaperone GrpE (heat shock protein)
MSDEKKPTITEMLNLAKADSTVMAEAVAAAKEASAPEPESVEKGRSGPPPMDESFAVVSAKAEEREATEADEAAKAEAKRLKPDRDRIGRLLQPVSDEWVTVEGPPRSYLLNYVDENGEEKGLFPSGRVGLLAAPGGTGKSFALIDLAVAVATDGSWLEAFPVDSEGGRGRVLLAMAEEDAEEMRRRLWSAMESRRLTPSQRRAVASRIDVLPLAGEQCALTKDGNDNDVRTTFADALEEALRERVATDDDGWAVLLLDPVSRFAGPDAEKDNAAATRFIQVLESLTKLPGSPSILAAVHTNKGGSKEHGYKQATDASLVRGSSAFVDGARWVAGMSLARKVDGTAETDLLWLGVAKSNYSRRPERPTLLRRIEGGALEAEETEAAQAAIEMENKVSTSGEGSQATPAEREIRSAAAAVNAASNALDRARKVADLPNKYLKTINRTPAHLRQAIDVVMAELMPLMDAAKPALESTVPKIAAVHTTIEELENTVEKHGTGGARAPGQKASKNPRGGY